MRTTARWTCSIPDGNWSRDDIAAASDLDTVRQLVEEFGASAEQAAPFASVVSSVADRLAGTGDRWEELDQDLSLWQRNSGLITIGTVALAALSFTPCSAVCAAGAAVLATGSAIDTCEREGVSLRCGVAATSAALSVTGAGAAGGNVLGKGVATGASKAGMHSYSASWQTFAATSKHVADGATNTGFFVEGFNQLPIVQMPPDHPDISLLWAD